VISAGWCVSAASEGDLVDSTALATAGLVKYWQCPIPVRGNETLDRLSLEDDTVYAMTSGGAIHAIDARVGLIRWSTTVTEPPFRVFRPCHPISDDPNAAMQTCVATTTHVMIYHRRSGRLLVRMKLPFKASGPPIADAEAIYIGSVNNRYYCLERVAEGLIAREPERAGKMWYAVFVLPGGKRLYYENTSLEKVRGWQQGWIDRLGGLQRERKAPVVRWQIDTEGNVKARPAVVKIGPRGNLATPRRSAQGEAKAQPTALENIACIPSDGGKLFVCGLFKKAKKWILTATGGIVTEPLVGHGMVYVASTGRSIYAAELASGNQQWQCYLPVPLNRTGTLTKTLLYQPGGPSGMYAIEPLTGKLRWAFDQAGQFLAEHEGTAYLFQPGEAVYQIDVTTGTTVRSMASPVAMVSVPSPHETTLYIASEDGRLMCIRPKDVPYLRRAQFEKALGGSSAPKDKTTGEGEPR
jgi:outer membrane protein assembly factor BamB